MPATVVKDRYVKEARVSLKSSGLTIGASNNTKSTQTRRQFGLSRRVDSKTKRVGKGVEQTVRWDACSYGQEFWVKITIHGTLSCASSMLLASQRVPRPVLNNIVHVFKTGELDFSKTSGFMATSRCRDWAHWKNCALGWQSNKTACEAGLWFWFYS